ncbi:MAG: hypothetical protein ACR2NU_05000, partial [Aeoliella sp.]
LRRTQQALGQATIALGAQPVSNFATPASRFPRVAEASTPADALRLARRSRRLLLPVERTDGGKREFVGYVRAADCVLAATDALPVRPILTIGPKQSYLATITQLLAADCPLACVVDDKDNTSGFVTLANLQAALLAD